MHQTAIIKNNPKKYLRSVGDGEVVEFDVVEGEKQGESVGFRFRMVGFVRLTQEGVRFTLGL